METSLNDILLSICKEYDLSEDSIQPIKSKLSKEFYFKLKDFKNLNTKQWKEYMFPDNLYNILLDKYAQEIDEFTSTNEVYEMINDVLETEYGFKNYNDNVAYKVMKAMSKMYSNYLEESKNMKVYTKKQLKEARVNKLVKESNKPITKKQLSIK